jgi:hypothetical protein
MAREHTPEHDTDAAREPTMAALAAAIPPRCGRTQSRSCNGTA